MQLDIKDLSWTWEDLTKWAGGVLFAVGGSLKVLTRMADGRYVKRAEGPFSTAEDLKLHTESDGKRYDKFCNQINNTMMENVKSLQSGLEKGQTETYRRIDDMCKLLEIINANKEAERKYKDGLNAPGS